MRTRQVLRDNGSNSRRFSYCETEKEREREKRARREMEGGKRPPLSLSEMVAHLSRGETFTAPKQPLIKRRERRSSLDFGRFSLSSLFLWLLWRVEDFWKNLRELVDDDSMKRNGTREDFPCSPVCRTRWNLLRMRGKTILMIEEPRRDVSCVSRI